jgi:hypothetical protein
MVAERRCHVNSDVTGDHVDRLHDFALRQLQAPSVSACDHRACGVGILSLPAEPSPGRGDAARARHCRLLRDGAAVGDEVRARLCPPPQAQERASRRDIWHLDEVVVTIGGKQHWLWRAVGECQESCVRGRFSHHALTNLSSQHHVCAVDGRRRSFD